MSGPPADVSPFLAKADPKSAAGDIDPLQFVRRQKIYVFHGYNDAMVARPVTDAAADFYRHYLGEANRGNLFYQTTIGAGHSLAVAQDQPVPASTTARPTPARLSTSAATIRPESSCSTFTGR